MRLRKIKKAMVEADTTFSRLIMEAFGSTNICSEHFDESDFVYREINKLPRNRRLKKNAVPNRFRWTQEVKRRSNPLEKYRERKTQEKANVETIKDNDVHEIPISNHGDNEDLSTLEN